MEKKSSFESENFSGSEENEIESEKEEDKNKIDENSELNLPNYNLIKAISHMLESIIEDSKNVPNYKSIIKSQSKDVFSANIVPVISIQDYLIRIQTYSNPEKSTLIISLILIDRLCHRNGITLTFYNIHRILFSSILISIKYNEDIFYNNKYYSQIAGVKPKELKLLEYTFVKMVNFRLFINSDVYQKYESYLFKDKNEK